MVALFVKYLEMDQLVYYLSVDRRQRMLGQTHSPELDQTGTLRYNKLEMTSGPNMSRIRNRGHS